MSVDREGLQEYYDDVRDDATATTWAVFKYDGKVIKPAARGDDYSEFLTHFNPDDRVYGFIRVETGDELSKRAKFALITWVGENINAVKRAQVSTDKAFVKDIIKNYAKEILADRLDEIQYDTILAEIRKVGGANYGTGVRK